jgi:hypothetical protein
MDSCRATDTKGELDGSGIYLSSGLIITAAHLTSAEANMGALIAGVTMPAILVKQGQFEDVDLSLLSVDQQKLPATVAGSKHLCVTRQPGRVIQSSLWITMGQPDLISFRRKSCSSRCAANFPL